MRRRVGGRARPVVVVACLALLVVGCAEPPGSPTPDGDAGRDARIAEVVAARAAVQQDVTDLLAAARDQVVAVGTLRAAGALSSDERAEAAGRAATGVEVGVAAVAAVRLDGDGPDVAAARAALEDVAQAGLLVDEALDAEVAELDLLASFDARLADVAAEWDRPGSRGDRRLALLAAAEEAVELEAEASTAGPVVPCLEVWQRRAGAAAVVAARTEELATLAGGSTGEQYDAARDEWRGDPTGLGAPLSELDAAAASCWEATAPAAAAVGALAAAVDEVEAALVPEDLQR